VSIPAARVAARERGLLFTLALSPIVAFLAIYLLGYLKFARLGALGLAAVTASAVVFLRPRWGLYFIVFYVYSGMGLFMPFNLAAPVLAVIVVAMLLDWVRLGDFALPGAFFWISVGLFTLVALLSMLVAHDIGASLHEMMTFGKVLLVVVLVVHFVRTPDHLRGLCYIVFAGAVGTVVLGVAAIVLGLQGTGENALGGGFGLMRFTGAHENPNKAAAYMCAALPLGIFAVRHCASRVLRVAFLLGIVVLIAGIFATFSRSVIIALVVVLIGVGAHEMRSRRSFVVLGVVLALGILLAPRYYWERVMNLPDAIRDTSLDWSVYTRMMALRTAWEMFLDHPLTGVGIGHFLGASAYQLFVRIVVHNTYLEILVGTGIVGLCLFLAMLWSGIREAVAGARRRWLSHPAWMRSLSFYLVLSAISICISGFFATLLFRYPLWLPVAAGLVVRNLMREDRSSHEPALS